MSTHTHLPPDSQPPHCHTCDLGYPGPESPAQRVPPKASFLPSRGRSSERSKKKPGAPCRKDCLRVSPRARGRGRSFFGLRTPRRRTAAPAQHKQPRSARCGGAAHSRASTSAPPPRGEGTRLPGLGDPTPEQGPPPLHKRSHRFLRDARFTGVSGMVWPQVLRKPDPRSRSCGETPDLQRHRKANHGGCCGREVLGLQPVAKVVPGPDAVQRREP